MNGKRSGKKKVALEVWEMSIDVFAESLKSPACVEILFNCLRNVENQMKEIFFMTKSTNEQLIKVSKLEK